FYLSLTVAGQDFLGFQWDSLLLEAGLLAILFAPWGLRLDGARREPSHLVVGLIRWLVFRVMFLSGVVKLASGDPTWRAWDALRFHYETQPLPTWTSWYAHQGPEWFQKLSVGWMFWAELLAPLLVFAPRRLRWVAFGSIVLLQVQIVATGNFGFFNLLTIVLCVALVEDRDWGRRAAEGTPAVPEGWPRRVVVGAAGAVIALVTTLEAIDATPWTFPFPEPLPALQQAVRPLRSMNAYGLFAVMTTERPEIVVEGSADGMTWRPYAFRWKPGAVDRRPRFCTPHMPRLDWQMWFAALAGDCRAQPWFLRFEARLLEGSPSVLALLSEDPFPGRPPRFVRARLDRYRFTRWGASTWWQREDLGLYCPPLEGRDDSGPPSP
ncbi:MAG TPA: lipase maturation factor family protein, partial [Isosphaeraceae bacterium]